MTAMQALRQWSTDIPNLAISISLALVAWIITEALGKDPDIAETVWFGLSGAGFYYHWIGLYELKGDDLAIRTWHDHDAVDLEAVQNQIRREKSRLTAKGIFAVAGITMMFVPPKALQNYEDITQLVVVLLIMAVVALDVDAILDRRSRRRQIDLIKTAIERRRARRLLLESRFRPIFELLANATSIKGRELAHDISSYLSVILGCMEILRGSSRLDQDEQDLLRAMDEAVDSTVIKLSELHQLVRDLAIKEAETDEVRFDDTSFPPP